MFGFLFNRKEKRQELITETPNIKVEGRPMINSAKLHHVAVGQLPITTPVGREVINKEWFTLFVATRKDGTVIRDKQGNICLNRR